MVIKFCRFLAGVVTDSLRDSRWLDPAILMLSTPEFLEIIQNFLFNQRLNYKADVRFVSRFAVRVWVLGSCLGYSVRIRVRFVCAGLVRVWFVSASCLVRVWFVSGCVSSSLVLVWFMFGSCPVRVWFRSGFVFGVISLSFLLR